MTCLRPDQDSRLCLEAPPPVGATQESGRARVI